MRIYDNHKQTSCRNAFRYLYKTQQLYGSIQWKDGSLALYQNSLEDKVNYERDHDGGFVLDAKRYSY